MMPIKAENLLCPDSKLVPQVAVNTAITRGSSKSVDKDLSEIEGELEQAGEWNFGHVESRFCIFLRVNLK